MARVDTVRVLIADDQPLIRAGFRSLLDSEDDIDVVGEAGDGAEAVRVARAHAPDVALLDIQMPVMDGIEATRGIAADADLSRVRVVILTNYALDEYVFAAIRGGASGFLVKDTDPAELIRSVRVAAAGEALLSPVITQRLIAEFTARVPTTASIPTLELLTDREREVMSLVAAGLTNEEIGERLHISPTTAKTHVSRVMIKLNARDRAQLVVFAYESGLVTPRAPPK